MADEYSKYKLFRKYKTEDGVNYTPLDEYQALYESGDGKECDCGYYELSSTTRHFSCVNGNEYMTINSIKSKTLYYMDDVHWTGSIYKNYEPLISDYTIIITDYNKDKYNSSKGGTTRTFSLSVDIEVLKDFELNIYTLSESNEELGGTIINANIGLNICVNNENDCEYVGRISNMDNSTGTQGSPYKRFLTKGNYTLLFDFYTHLSRYYNNLYFIFGSENGYFNGEMLSEYYAKVCDGNFIEWGDEKNDGIVELKSSCGFNYLKYDLIEENLTTVPSMNYTTTLATHTNAVSGEGCNETKIEQIDVNEYDFSFGCHNIEFNIKVDTEQDYTYLVFKFETTDSGVYKENTYNTYIDINYPRENDILGFYNGYDEYVTINPSYVNPDNSANKMFKSEVIVPIKHRGTNYIYIYGHCSTTNTTHNVKLTITQLTEGNFNHYKMAKYSTENTFVEYIDKDKYELIE